MYKATWKLVNGATNEEIEFTANFESYVAAEIYLENIKKTNSDNGLQTEYFVEGLRIEQFE